MKRVLTISRGSRGFRAARLVACTCFSRSLRNIFVALLRQPLADRGHVVLVMLERVAGDQLPGSPLLRHVLEALRVIQVLVAQHLYCFEECSVCLMLFVDDVV